VQVATALGFAATCNRDRDMLGATDRALRRVVQAEGYVFVTDNASDFRPMYAADAIHPGLGALPGAVGRARQQALTRAVVAFIAERASAAGERPADFMVNTLVTIDASGACRAWDLPPA